MDAEKFSKESTANANTAFIGIGHFLPGGSLLPEGIKGVTDTYLGMIELESGCVRAYAKIIHPWFVFNEVLGSLLCQLSGLKTPRPYLALVQRDDYPEARIFAETGAPLALAFATEAMPQGSLTRHISLNTAQALRQLVSQWVGWPHVLVFDQWIANPDRHGGNLLVGAPGEIYLIDHGFAFLRRNWQPEFAETARTMVTARLWKDILSKVITTPQRIEATAQLYAAAMEYSLIDVANLIATSAVSGLLPQENVEPLLNFLTHRIAAAATVLCGVIGVPALDFRSPQ
jgi:hypothetical protein